MITSPQNDRIKELRKLHDKKHRERSGRFVAEGEDLVRAALNARWQPLALYCVPEAPEDLRGRPETESVDEAVLASASVLGSGSRVIGLFEERWSSAVGDYRLGVYLDAIADPGNVGTVLRSAVAFADGPVILGPGCADPYSPKAVRASMGAVFARPPARADVSELAHLPARRVALDPACEFAIRDVGTEGSVVLCVGAERRGLSTEVSAVADERAAIPMRAGGAESLNAGVAASIALYELSTARSGSGSADLQGGVHRPGNRPGATGESAANQK